MLIVESQWTVEQLVVKARVRVVTKIQRRETTSRSPRSQGLKDRRLATGVVARGSGWMDIGDHHVHRSVHVYILMRGV